MGNTPVPPRVTHHLWPASKSTSWRTWRPCMRHGARHPRRALGRDSARIIVSSPTSGIFPRPTGGGRRWRRRQRRAGWGTRELYATWQMRGAGRVCYRRWSERDPLAAVDAESRSHGEGTTPQRMRVSPHSPVPLTPTFAWPPRLRGATGGTGHDGWCRAPAFCVRRATGSRC